MNISRRMKTQVQQTMYWIIINLSRPFNAIQPMYSSHDTPLIYLSLPTSMFPFSIHFNTSCLSQNLRIYVLVTFEQKILRCNEVKINSYRMFEWFCVPIDFIAPWLMNRIYSCFQNSNAIISGNVYLCTRFTIFCFICL